jgi:hypothetical protein
MKVMLYEMFTGQGLMDSERNGGPEAPTKHKHNPRISVKIFAPLKSQRLCCIFCYYRTLEEKQLS